MRGYLMIILFCFFSILPGVSCESRDSIGEIAFLGDSNLWTGGEDCHGGKAWSTWLVRLFGIPKARSFARSGATVTNTVATVADTTFYSELLHNQNTLYNQALRLNGAVEKGELNSPDMIIVYGGSNDAWFHHHRPELFDTSGINEEIDASVSPAEAVTLEKSLRLILSVLKEKNPDSRLVIVGPPFMVKTSRENISKVNDIMEKVASKENLLMIRLDNDSILNPDSEKIHFTFTYDGVHTVPAGARKIAEYVKLHINQERN